MRAHTDDPASRFAPGTVFTTRAAPGTGVPRTLTLATARLHQQTWLLGFEEIPDRTGAESLRGTTLHLSGEGLEDSEPDEESWYEEDLLGLAVHAPDGARIGEVCGLVSGSAQDLLVVRLEDGVEAMVPFVTAIVPEVDVPGGRVVVDAPPGLFDLARE